MLSRNIATARLYGIRHCGTPEWAEQQPDQLGAARSLPMIRQRQDEDELKLGISVRPVARIRRLVRWKAC